ncbi:ankyrin repeat domain-containing protein [Pollutimonas sp. M17]|uniref:ankyrin repeat domain-containing protein n=1 Tax=Pollutimonas sp. M17 TaxID=2962065 RepID=UPI0021F49215|nr:ankyrin repeat domain-containing protein [Pollutimonas sp. M17]UYO95385.1 ankyrin repeat domain-containing protein [Pollutimonas sp. M17]
MSTTFFPPGKAGSTPQARTGARLAAVLAGLLLSMAAHAANPSNWWVDIANDRAGSIKTMLARGADPNEISPKGQPAIMQAIRDGAWDVYDVLAANPKTALNAINVNRETPLMYLAVVGETKRAQELIRRGAMVNRLGWTPLQYAASKGHLDTVKMLVANKATVNAPGPDGTTALMMAAYGGSEPVVRFLLESGADATMQNLQKQDAADWARLKKHTALAEKLDELSAKVLAQRAALRNRGDSGGQADSGDGVKTVDLNDGAATAPATAAAKKKEPAKDASSTSRYFDLDRFNEPAEP